MHWGPVGHDHDEDGELLDLMSRNTPEWIELKSVGIDIGSTTSHLTFSDIVLRRQGLALSSRYVIIKREVSHQSPVFLTPYLGRFTTTIDTEHLGRYINEAYRSGNLEPGQIDTGALIVTGEAVRKENAEAIASLFAKEAGKFVCATAGPNLEAVLSTYGAGAVERSRPRGGISQAVMNVDVGGGTTKVAIARHGEIVETCAVNLGARLVAVDNTNRIVRLEEAGKAIAASVGLNLDLDQQLDESQKEIFARAQADLLFQYLEGKPFTGNLEFLMITPPPQRNREAEIITFSGGVSEYIYGYETRDFGDLGRHLSRSIREHLERRSHWVLEEPKERIRATVIGASQFTIQVSGNTIFLTHPHLLPMHNVQVVSLDLDGDALTTEEVSLAVERSLRRFDLVDGEKPVALAIHWDHGPDYSLIRPLAAGIAQGLSKSFHRQFPVIMVFDSDVGGLVGSLLVHEFAPDSHVVSIDQVELRDFDYIDIGREIENVGVVPVVIKSLLFR
ncbi:MAG: ethanolamine ammonia-lyase reactivating factor EutA [Candidatus Tectomicrobia bacterium]|uniref:Ethanolamine ammonia-lyase reactivating factor EutA n=1 Tax=Tectimicrobiota bacterium TaxID=2528274 RepID=A0A932GPV2_UNCTE|nr:ethanolamine ammonia-lyase reactivating factor EutA [Candidatus Tectomicrobia bacterium]